MNTTTLLHHVVITYDQARELLEAGPNFDHRTYLKLRAKAGVSHDDAMRFAYCFRLTETADNPKSMDEDSLITAMNRRRGVTVDELIDLEDSDLEDRKLTETERIALRNCYLETRCQGLAHPLARIVSFGVFSFGMLELRN